MDLLNKINGMILYCENKYDDSIDKSNYCRALKYTKVKYSLEQVKEEISKLGMEED